MNLLRPNMDPIPFISSAEAEKSEEANLMSVTYTRVQQASPDFKTVHEGIDQNVDMKLSTFIFQAAPEPVLSLYDFIMTTFVPERDSHPEPAQELISSKSTDELRNNDLEIVKKDTGKIRVLIKLASVQGKFPHTRAVPMAYRNRTVLLINDDRQLATLSLSTADVTVLLHADTLLVTTRLGNLLITDDSSVQTTIPEFKQILSIEGDDFAEFRYQTFDPRDTETYKGVKSAVHLKAGSLKLHFLEQASHDIYLFLIKLARLKGLYDAATQAAVQKAAEIERMSFEISVKTPIIIFPADATRTRDVLTMRLGEIVAQNNFRDEKQNISASLRGIQLTSTTYTQDDPLILKIIDDVDIATEVTQTTGIDRSKDVDFPDYQVIAFPYLSGSQVANIVNV